jgi:CO/xanthine dehydrogenase Mo-binding subunit
VYTNNPPSGAFRGYGLGQVMFALESAMDELARRTGVSPFELRRRNAVRPGDPVVVTDPDEESDLQLGGYGLPEALALAEAALAEPGEPAPDGPRWRVGTGMALGMIATMPPRGHFSEVRLRLDADGGASLDVGTAEFGNGTTTVHAQIVAEVLAIPADAVRIRSSDTDGARYDTGAFGSAGTVVAGRAVHRAALALRAAVLEAAGPGAALGPDGVRTADGLRPLSAFAPLETTGSADGTPRGLAFNVHGFRVAVDTGTGEVRILKSVQGVDAGTVLNPEQLRGQVEGGTAQAIGSALYEEVRVEDGHVLTRTLRNYHIPQMADVPRTEVRFAATYDDLGPFGAKSMSEAPYNPIAPALANAIRDAIGVRPHELPMTRDRLWRLLRP